MSALEEKEPTRDTEGEVRSVNRLLNAWLRTVMPWGKGAGEGPRAQAADGDAVWERQGGSASAACGRR